MESISNQIESWLISSMNLSHGLAIFLRVLFMILFALIIAYAVWRLIFWVLHRIVPKLTSRTRTIWDDALLNKEVLNALALLLPVLLLDSFAPLVFDHSPEVIPFIDALTAVFIIFAVAYIAISLLNAVRGILTANPSLRDKPIGSFTQLGKILTYAVAGILAISVIFDKSPVYLLSGIGAVAAVVLLVFKDSILGFVASVQLSANDMVHVGDWVSVPKYNADGTVQEINLTTIKVQNFDKTITTIPTYVFVADSFTNWRGMEQSAGRRIKRSISIQISSIRFCTQEMIHRFEKIHLVKDYIAERQKQIHEFNLEHEVDTDVLVNGRKLTNIGIFQVYLENYLRNSPSINQDMTIMVRQLTAGPTGVPIEIYAFSKDKEWVNYEKIVADLFDHTMASAESFDLRIFENPSGSDFQGLNSIRSQIS